MVLDWIGYYVLTEENVEKYVPQEAGVYKISVEQSDGHVYPVYVGQAGHSVTLYGRMRQYLNSDTDNQCLKDKLQSTCYFKVAEVGSGEDRDAVERALYDKYEPKCNDPDAIPDVEPADVNCD